MIRTNVAVVGFVALGLALGLYLPTANAQTIVGTAHDLSTSSGSGGATTNVDRVCVFCHTPHQAAAANGQDPLWNHTLSGTAAYGVYASATFNGGGTIADIGGAAAGTAATSNLCMSCHDGTIGVGSLYNDPNEVAGVTVTDGGNVVAGLITGNPNVGTDLTDDHPVNFTYDTALYTADGGATGGLYDPATTPAAAALLIGGEVQCSSCHDPHDDTNSPFMTMDNTGSALCLTCHNK